MNASFGPQSPTALRRRFADPEGSDPEPGRLWRPLAWSFLAKPANLALGLEARKEIYEIQAGDRHSWDVGPGAPAAPAQRLERLPGYAPSQAGSGTRTSYGGPMSTWTSPITDKFGADVAVRHEDFSEFGQTTDGKIAARYEFTPNFAIRGAVSTGFRAPTAGQINNTRTSQGLNTTTLLLFTSGRLSPVNPISQAPGAKPLEPEESKHPSAGRPPPGRLRRFGRLLPHRGRQPLRRVAAPHGDGGVARPTGRGRRPRRRQPDDGQLLHQLVRHAHPGRGRGR
ncbi:TonB-dependent receptor domain-containing protein, partial [Caulobacter segnis]